MYSQIFNEKVGESNLRLTVDLMHFGCVIGDHLVLPFYMHFNFCCGVTLGNYTIV